MEENHPRDDVSTKWRNELRASIMVWYSVNGSYCAPLIFLARFSHSWNLASPASCHSGPLLQTCLKVSFSPLPSTSRCQSSSAHHQVSISFNALTHAKPLEWLKLADVQYNEEKTKKQKSNLSGSRGDLDSLYFSHLPAMWPHTATQRPTPNSTLLCDTVSKQHNSWGLWESFSSAQRKN